MLLTDIFLFLIAYLVGSIPFSYLIAKITKNVDLKKVGSRNPGGSNAIWKVGLVYGILGGFLDIAKGSLLILLGKYFYFSSEELEILTYGAICGHCWSAFLGFKGGRGVATTFGTVLFLYPKRLLLIIIPGVLFLILKLIGIRKFKGIFIDSAIGTFIGILSFIIFSICSSDLSALRLGIIVGGLLLVRRVTENPLEYREKDGAKIFLARLFYDRPSLTPKADDFQ